MAPARCNHGPTVLVRAATLLMALAVPGPVAGRRTTRRRVDLSVMQPPPGTPMAHIVEENIVPSDAGSSRAYLIASFPEMEQVAYCHAPDNVWRPLVIGDMTGPNAVAVDSQNARLFVADASNGVIWHYQLHVRPGGLLETAGLRRAAVQGYNASWIAVNSIGDLYFVGRAAPAAGAAGDPFDSIYRMEAQSIARGDPLNPIEVYSRSNTGSPDSRVWMPSGLDVDSFYIYWGNSANGTTHGSVNRGSRMNIGLAAQDMTMDVMNTAFDEVRGITATGTHVFFLTPTGVHGVLKTDSGVSNPALGLIATENGAVANTSTPAAGHFTDITWDGANSLYVSATGAAGAIYTLPALNTQAHSLTKFVDAPGIQSVAMYLHVQNPRSNARPSQAPAVLTQLVLAVAMVAGLQRVRG